LKWLRSAIAGLRISALLPNKFGNMISNAQ